MVQRFDETKAVICYDGPVEFSGIQLIATLHDNLMQHGFYFHHFEVCDVMEVQAEGLEFIVSVIVPENRPTQVHVAVENLSAPFYDEKKAEERFRLCVGAVRAFTDIMPADTVIWRHEGGRYVTKADGSLRVIRKPDPGPSPEPGARAARPGLRHFLSSCWQMLAGRPSIAD